MLSPMVWIARLHCARSPSRLQAVWGIADRTGSLEIGKDADLVVWSGDPFELTTAAERVFIRGSEISKDTRQKALFERYRTIPR